MGKGFNFQTTWQTKGFTQFWKLCLDLWYWDELGGVLLTWLKTLNQCNGEW